MKTEKQSPTPIPAVTKNIPAMDLNYSDYKDDVSREPIVEEVEPERGNWTGRFDFLLSLLGYSVGLGNVWRFPYLCYNNGGGAFLIPFTVMLIIAGLPLMFMELSFGQYAALGPVAVYNRFCPLFRGLGYGMVIVSSIVMLYYNLIIAWTIYYMVVSFTSIFYQLPWQNCDADWSTKYCYSYEEADICEASNGTYYLRQCVNQSYAIVNNIIALADTAVRKPPAEEYFTNQVLGLSSGIEETGQIRWGMAACLFAAWLIVFLCLCKGVQSSGKVVYFTALFPYVVLVILFFRGVTLPGASTGILFYLTPDFSQLANAQVWGDAAVQIFFALSPAWGGLITLSSYNKFSNNCYIDSLIVAVSNIATSFFAGLVIFSVIGFLAHELEVEVDRVVDQGAGLAFIVYPEVVTRLPVSPLWSILFFVMLLTLGLDSQFALMETVTTAILDRFPKFRQKKTWVVLAVAVFGYLGGLIFTTNSGMYWLQLMDKYAANWSVLIIAIGECILIAWIYGAEKFCIDIQTMIGRQSRLWVVFWSAMWRIITPAALVFILVFNWIEYKPASYGHYVYPMWADAVGWTLGVLPIVVVVLMAVNQICSGPDDLTIMETSQDGADSTSIGSGLDNELKKPSTSTNKVKKNSIKRKVPNFSHDSDDAIIEPLLQTEKDNSVIANKSAKYLLNKSKTESMCEKDAKSYEKAKISSPSSISNNVASTVDKRTSPLTSESPPIYNHMNTNVFSGYDLTKEKTTTASSSVLVEIDGCKIVSQGSNPVIFTTAKIHADNKTKAIEPVPVTTVPILSTIEGNIVKSGVIYEDNKRYNVSQTNKADITKNVNLKSDLTLESSNFNNQPHAKISPSAAPTTSMYIKNEQNKNKELLSTGSSEQSEKLFSKDQKVSLGKGNTNTSDERSLMPKVTSDDKITTKVATNVENTTYKSNGVVPDTSKELIKSSNKPNTLNKSNIAEKTKPSSDVEKITTNQSTTSSSKQSSKSNVSPQSDQTDSSKNFSSSIKKLQRQKNAMIEEAVESGKKDLAKDKPCTEQNSTVKDVSTAVSVNTKTIQKPVTSLTKVAITCTGPTVASAVPSKSINTTVLSPSIQSPLISPGTSKTLTNKPSTGVDTAQAKSTSTKSPETSGKLATKPSLNITTKVTTASSTKTSTSSNVKSMKVIDEPFSPKQDSSLVSTSSSKIPKAETSPTSSVVTTLPLYIVSTSKTKIGSSSTPSISNVTKKTLDQKPITEVVSTGNGKSGKTLMSTSSSQNSRSGSKPKTSTVNLVKKDDRA